MAAAPSGLLRRISMGYCTSYLLPPKVGDPFSHLNHGFFWLGAPGRPLARPTIDCFSRSPGDLLHTAYAGSMARQAVKANMPKIDAKPPLVARSNLFCSPPFREVFNYNRYSNSSWKLDGNRHCFSSRNQVSVSHQACRLFSKSNAKKKKKSAKFASPRKNTIYTATNESKEAASSQQSRKKAPISMATSKSKAASSRLSRTKAPNSIANSESNAASSQQCRKKAPISTASSESNAASIQQSSNEAPMSMITSESKAASSQQSRTKAPGGSSKAAFRIYKARQNNSRKVVVVESPAKAKTIQKYLGDDYTVLPSNGHVRGLAGRSGSVRPDNDYALVWEVTPDACAQLDKIMAALRNAKYLVLACDPDREGEAIAWHVSELMNAEGFFKQRRINVQRVVFNEITKSAIQQAMESPRDINMTLVNAYLARRAIDYLIGFDLSPLLWRKLPGSRSAGRVQSAALSLICEREKMIEDFVSQEYWTVNADACRAIDLHDACDTGFEMSSLKESVQKLPVFCVRPTIVDGKKLERLSLTSEAQAKAVAGSLLSTKFTVSSVKKGLMRRNPPKPFITSSLQQDAQNKLGFSASRTMHLAQQIYEGVNLGNNEATGLITYMRTDSYKMSEEAVRSIRTFAAKRYGEEYVPVQPRQFDTKVKNAQEAHEAIRPTDIRRLPSTLMDILEMDALRLYSLIWRHSMACQMEQAVYNETTIDFTDETKRFKLQASSSFVSFSGFMAALQDMEGNPSKQGAIFEGDIDKTEETEGNQKLPQLQPGDLIKLIEVKPKQHFTAGPSRYTEGSLVRKLEELGIGRPSTYASILKVLLSRRYVTVENKSIHPELRGCMVSAFLWRFFPKFMDYKFTANLEEQLDQVSAGCMNWKDVLRNFWPDFHAVVTTTMKIPLSKIVELLAEIFATQFFKGVGENKRICPSCGIGKMTLKLTRYGSGYFFGCNMYPECRYTTNVLGHEDAESMQRDGDGAQSNQFVIASKIFVTLGIHPVSQKQILLKTGPFGKYIQLGPDGKGRKCFKIPEGIKPQDMTLEKALDFMRYPLVLGKHPDDGETVWLGIGNRHFYIRHRAAIATLPKGVQLDNVTLNMALELLSGDKVKRRGRTRSALKDHVSQSKARKPQKGNKNHSVEVCPKKANSKKFSEVCHKKNSKGETQLKKPGVNNVVLSKKGGNMNTRRMPKRTPLKKQGSMVAAGKAAPSAEGKPTEVQNEEHSSANGCPESGTETTDGVENSTFQQEIFQAVG